MRHYESDGSIYSIITRYNGSYPKGSDTRDGKDNVLGFREKRKDDLARASEDYRGRVIDEITYNAL